MACLVVGIFRSCSKNVIAPVDENIDKTKEKNLFSTKLFRKLKFAPYFELED